jgi:hypothetical protein
MRKLKILLYFSTVISFSTLQAQTDYTISGKSVYEIRTQTFPEWTLPSYTTEQLTVAPTMLDLKVVEPDWTAHYFAHLGFFCKVEIKLEHQTRFPVKFRLGTVEYTERLEGKR